MTAPRRLREWERAHDGLSELVSRLSVKKYQEALNEAYAGPSGAGNGRTTGGDRSDPTTAALEATGRKRHCLRLTNKALDDALRRLEDAASALDEILEGPNEVEQRARAISLAQRRMCSRCGEKEAKARGLCGTCLEYERRTGRERPERLVKEAWWKSC